MTSPRAEELLRSLFSSSGELLRWLRRHPETRLLVDDLPGSDAPMSNVAHDAVVLLESRGLVHEMLRLLADDALFSHRQDEILTVRSAYRSMTQHVHPVSNVPARDAQRNSQNVTNQGPVFHQMIVGGNYTDRRPPRALAFLAAFIVAAVLLLVLWATGAWSALSIRLTPSEELLSAALETQPPLEVRLTHPGADVYRLDGSTRSASVAPTRDVPVEVVLELKRRKDRAGLVAVALFEGHPDDAANILSEMPETADVLSDRAAVLLSRARSREADGEKPATNRETDEEKPATNREADEEALLLTSRALHLNAKHPQALWNRAIALERLGLNRQGEEAYHRCAEVSAGGWSREAADAERRLVEERQRTSVSARSAVAAAQALISTGTPMPADVATQSSSLAQRAYYEAICGADTEERLAALEPLAAQLDSIFGEGGKAGHRHAETHIERTRARFDARRARIASVYSRLAGRISLSEKELDLAMSEAMALGHHDLFMCFITRRYNGTVPFELLEDYKQAAAASGSVWFEFQSLFYELSDIMARGFDYSQVLQRARDVEDSCAAEPWVDVACAQLDELIAIAYISVVELELGGVALDRMLERAARTGDLFLQRSAWLRLGDMHMSRDEYGSRYNDLAVAYLSEFVSPNEQDCWSVMEPRISMALGAVNRLDFAQAEYQLALLESSCPEESMDLNEAFVRAHLAAEGRLEDAEYDRFISDLQSMQQGVTPDLASFLLHIEGRARSYREPGLARVRLREAIDGAAASPDPELAERARAYSYRLLALELMRHGEAEQAMETLREELGAPSAESCAVGIAVDGRVGVAVAGVDGITRGTVLERRPGQPHPDPDDVIPPELVETLKGCERVAVLTRAPYHGQPQLLPGDLAWFFIADAGTADRPKGASARGEHLIIAAVEPIPTLNRPRLTLPPVDNAASILTGPTLTRSNALERMRRASLIEIHAHTQFNAITAQPELLLSPDAQGRRALSGAEIVNSHLESQPVVLIAASHGGRTSARLYRSSSLADAFLLAGARAVIGAPSEIPDHAAAEAFHVLARSIHDGADPAEALRRLKTSSSSTTDAWVDDLVLFQVPGPTPEER
ncbi:MAG: CHAT domain-containing protein [Alphaproteobacteria bacterium]|nr:CHAT domain-containing protein [Alphaproteobacteria bacterium]